MTHLTDLELIAVIEDAVDRDLPAAQRRHLDACVACRGRADDLRAAIAAAGDATVPEPSPLFWQHFSARVRQGIDGAEPGAPAQEHRLAAWFAPWLEHGGVRWGIIATLVVAVMVAGIWQVSAPSRRTASRAVSGGAIDAPRTHPVQDGGERHDSDADPAWAVVRTVADSVEWSDDAVADIGVQPDAVETVARTLSPEERSELVKLLLAEAKRNGA